MRYYLYKNKNKCLNFYYQFFKTSFNFKNRITLINKFMIINNI